MIVRRDRNCWRHLPASRAAFLLDAAEYFAVLRRTLLGARRTVHLLAWDVDSRTELLRHDPGDGLPTALGDLLLALVERQPELTVWILDWDYSFVWALDREWRPRFRRGEWKRHPRLHFAFDGALPFGAAHHQKVVVVDDTVAFAGGIDLTHWRWDTPDHRAVNPLRRDASGAAYPPNHDVQMMVEGPVATALGELARERWRRATGELLPAAAPVAPGPWPSDRAADVADVSIAIARTEPAHDGRREVREAERLTLDAVAAARRSIYLESQYFTATSVCRALSARLAEPDGPEVVMILPLRRSAWIEEFTLGLLRSRCLRSLLAADRHGRLRVYYPHVPGLPDQVMNIHSKLVLVDDRFLRIGSSNLSNRSLGFDTECDLGFEAQRPADRAAIRDFHARLLADQLAVPVPRAAAALAAGGLIAAIDALRSPYGDQGRGLRPLEALLDETFEGVLPDPPFVDPARAVALERSVTELVGDGQRRRAERKLLVFAAAVAGAVALVAWRAARVPRRADDSPRRPAPPAPVFAGAGFASALVPLPLTLVVGVAAATLGGGRGFAWAWAGAAAGAGPAYALGARLGPRRVRRRVGGPTHRLGGRLAGRGALAVAAARLLPVAPFAHLNLALGAARAGGRSVVAGTLLGLVPPLLAVAHFVDRLARAARSGERREVAAAARSGALLVGGALLVRQALRDAAGGRSRSA